MRLTLTRYSSGVMPPQHAPGPRPTCASKHGRASRVEQGERVLVEAALEPAPVGARRGAQRHDAAGDVHHVAGGAAVGVGAEVACVSGRCFSRVYLMAGKTSPFVSAMKG